MDRSGARRWLRGINPLVIAVTALALVAGTLTAVYMPAGSRQGSGILAPGSSGSLRHYPWWDPRGWFEGSGAPSSQTVAGTDAAVAYPPRHVRQAKAAPAKRVGEVTSRRTEFSRTYLLSNGQQQQVISAGPVNYRDARGGWQPISTAVGPSSVPGYRYQNTSNVFQSFFGATASQLVRFNAPGGGWVSIGLAAGTVPGPQAHGDTVSYPDIAPGVTLSYEVTPRSLTERISLASAAAGASLASLPFTVSTGGGLTLRERSDGSIAVMRRGVPVLSLPRPFMTDAQRQSSSPLGYVWSPKVAQHESVNAAGNTMQLTVSPDAGWLTQPGRKFPVVVDPSIAIVPGPGDAQNTAIDSSQSSANFSTSWELAVGTDGAGAWRSLLSFPVTSTTLPANAQLQSADLRLFENLPFGPQAASPTIEVDQATAPWSAAAATWANASNNVGQQGYNQVTVDDSDPAWASASGAWPSAADANAVGSEYRYDQDSTPGDTFTWVPQLTESGNYQVQAHYVASPFAASNAPYTVNYDGGSAQYTVNQTAGSGGQWATLGTLPFAAGTAGSVVLGDGPASASTRVEADAVRLTKPATVVFTPAVNGNTVGNTWDTFSVGNIVQSWLDGASPNDGLVVKATDESTLNVGGPVYQASGAYYNETATYPQLVLTWGLPGVALNPVTTVHATGAELSWPAYTNTTFDTGKDLAGYEVYRGTSPSFAPDADTLIGTVAAATGSTSFTDTTATPTAPGSSTPDTVYYIVAVRTTDGTIIPGEPQAVQLPTAGSTTQVIDASGSATLSSALPDSTVSYTGGAVTVGNDNSSGLGVTRTLLDFPSMAAAGVPADATITSADLKMYGYWNDASAGGFYVVPSVAQPNDPATATWDDASAGTPWTTPGGSLASGLPDGVSGFTPLPYDADWPDDASFIQDWVTNPGDENGLMVQLSDESSAGPQETEWFWGATATEPALRPQLQITYTEPTAADTYYVPQLPSPLDSLNNYTVPVTLTNTTVDTWTAADYVLSYHWLTPDGTDVSDSDDQAQTALPADMPPGATVTINAAMIAANTAGTGDQRNGMNLAWDLYDKTTGTWLSSGTSTPILTAAGAVRLGSSGAARAGVTAADVPMAQGNHTVPVLKQDAAIEQPSSNKLGLETFYQYTGISTGSGSSILNNDYAGNTVWNYNAFSNPSRGFRTFVRLDYNSMDTSESSMGFGWSLQASTLQRLGTPLDFLPNIANPTTVKLVDGDGTGHLFTFDAATGQWLSPPGVHDFLQQEATCTPNGKSQIARAWLFTAPDRTQFWFDCQGYQSAVVDKNGNEADFFYTQRNSNNQPVKFLDYITDPTGRQSLAISYYHMGDNYSYVDDATGNLVSATNLTDPDIINMVKSITAINGRTISFFYDQMGLMSLMTDGDGSAITKTFKFKYDMTQGNNNVKLNAVTDPRGNTTDLAYFTAPVDPFFKWSLQSVSDRLQRTTSFAYTQTGNGAIQTVVTSPLGNAVGATPGSYTTTYQLDSLGRPVQSVNAKQQTTNLAWDTDNNVTSLTEDNGAQTTWTYDPNTGYPLTMHDAQANHDGTAGYQFTYQTSPDGHVADLKSVLTPQQRLWTLSYDNFGNLASVTQPLGNPGGVSNGTYTTKYEYNTDGTLKDSTDPDGNQAKYAAYDPSGNPQQVTDPLGNMTSYAYNLLGEATSVTDPLKVGPSAQDYDVFGRPLGSTVAKTATITITTPAPVYDGNDNVTQSTAPNGAVTTSQYNADDEMAQQVTPPNNNSAPTTTYGYDANGNLKTVTKPLGNVSGAQSNSYTTTNSYDQVNEPTSVLDPMSGLTQYEYDNVGNQTKVTSPNCSAILANGGSCQPTVTQYNLNHQPTQVTDPAGNFTKTHYDLDGLVDQTTDQNNNTTLYTLDADGQVTQAEVPAQAPGQPVSYDVTQAVYDQDGNQIQVISPRGVAAGASVTSSCVASQNCAFTQVTKYNADNLVSKVLSPFNPADPVYNTPAETDYTYNADGLLSQVSAPPSGNQTIRDVTNYSYYGTRWLQSETDPTGITTSYDYNPLGDQSSRVLTSAGGAMSRAMSWSYYPNGSLQSMSDNGVPTGMYAEVADNSDAGASQSPAGSWTTVSCTTSVPGCEEYEYRTHAAGTGADAFTWQLNAPEDGNYTVYVKYPVASGAAKNAAYTVAYSGGSATVNVDQTQDNNGDWVSLGKWAFTKGATNQQVTLTENSSGTVVAGAVEIVRDNAGDTNTATQSYAYTYDADGNETGIADNTTGAAITKYAIGYDQLNRNTSVEEDNAAGTAVHTTTYGYDADSNMTSMVHDGAPSTYQYNILDELTTETTATSATDPNPQVTSFPAYTPTGQVTTEVKPNGNNVNSTYYATGLLDTQTECTAANPQGCTTASGTLVSSHAYTYDPNGNQVQDIEQLMSAGVGGGYLSHTLTYAYDPMDRLATVTTDGTATEAYTHDGNGNVTSQTLGTTTTNYGYNLGQMQTASVVGGATDTYNYDPLGRLDTVTTASGGATQLVQQNTYNGLDNLSAVSQLNPSTGAMDTTSYAYDSLGRVTSQSTNAGTSSYSYLGLTGELGSESGPGGISKTYTYTPGGARLSQTITSGGTTTPGYYSYNAHGDVEAVTGTTGITTATYGYTAYGSPVTSMFTGQDAGDANPSQTTQPYSAYRFNAMRWDSGTGQYDMGFRTYDPGLNQFISSDMFSQALASQGLATDPFTGSRYAFGFGNPISNVELNGHNVCGSVPEQLCLGFINGEGGLNSTSSPNQTKVPVSGNKSKTVNLATPVGGNPGNLNATGSAEKVAELGFATMTLTLEVSAKAGPELIGKVTLNGDGTGDAEATLPFGSFDATTTVPVSMASPVKGAESAAKGEASGEANVFGGCAECELEISGSCGDIYKCSVSLTPISVSVGMEWEQDVTILGVDGTLGDKGAIDMKIHPTGSPPKGPGLPDLLPAAAAGLIAAIIAALKRLGRSGGITVPEPGLGGAAP